MTMNKHRVYQVELSNIYANPYRDIDNYPLDQNRIDFIKNMMKNIARSDDLRTTQFDEFIDFDIVCRKINDGYQVVYGHHRVEAARQIFTHLARIDIDVIDLSDIGMLNTVMLSNMNSIDKSYLLVSQSKKYFDALVCKHASLKSLLKSLDEQDQCCIKAMFKTPAWYHHAMQSGVDERHLSQFITSIKESDIKKILTIISDAESFDVRSARLFSSYNHALEYRKLCLQFRVDYSYHLGVAREIIQSINDLTSAKIRSYFDKQINHVKYIHKIVDAVCCINNRL